MNILPEIRIKYGSFLDEVFKSALTLHNYPVPDETKNKIFKFIEAWQAKEEITLRSICNFLQLDFRQNIIDVYIVGRGKTFSDPMVISGHFDPDEFTDILTHELIHRLLTDNIQGRKNKLLEYLKQNFYTEERLTRNHILVHAISKFVYLEILKEPARLNRDIQNCADNSAYKRSWEIVEQKGYRQLISEFMNS